MSEDIKKSEQQPVRKPVQPVVKKEEKSGSNGGIIVLVILLILALAGAGYLFYQVTELQAQLDSTEGDLVETTQEKDDLTSNLDAQIKEYEKLREDYEQRGLDVEELNSQIALLNEERDSYKAKLKSANADRRALNRRVNKLLAQSELDKQKLLEHIERLEFAKDSLSEEIDVLVEERSDLVIDNATLEQKVAVASILSAEDISISFLNSRGKEDTKGPFKASKANTLLVKSFLADNKVAEQDEKEFILRVVEPSGNVLFSLETGGGSFEAKDSTTKFFTQRKQLLYDNTNQPINFTYEKGDEYLEGVYKVEIYGDGYVIGESEFEIK